MGYWNNFEVLINVRPCIVAQDAQLVHRAWSKLHVRDSAITSANGEDVDHQMTQAKTYIVMSNNGDAKGLSE